ncbi:MAG: hypothetical protein KA354_23635 [Phycisphaerae bacterium]|nr:hypothetical protein [Phycisphaerae bacterium]
MIDKGSLCGSGKSVRAAARVGYSRIAKKGVFAAGRPLLRPVPESIRGTVNALVGCVAGAVLVEEHEAMVRAAGMQQIEVVRKREYIAALGQFEDPLYRKITEALPPGTTAADFITSIDVKACKNE